MRPSDEQVAEYKRLYHEHVRHSRLAQVFAMRCDAYATELLDEYNVPPGEEFDLWGDGEAKPGDKCKKPPGVKAE